MFGRMGRTLRASLYMLLSVLCAHCVQELYYFPLTLIERQCYLEQLEQFMVMVTIIVIGCLSVLKFSVVGKTTFSRL